MPAVDLPYYDINTGATVYPGDAGYISAPTLGSGSSGSTMSSLTSASGTSCPPLDCYQQCREADKIQQEKCKELNVRYAESMKAQGCPGTKCRTKPLGKSCRKRKSNRKCCKPKPRCKPRPRGRPPSVVCRRRGGSRVSSLSSRSRY